MSTTNKQTQAATFDPASMSAYHALIPGLQNFLGQYMGKGGPMTSPFFSQAMGGAQRQQSALGAGMGGAAASYGASPGVTANRMQQGGAANSLLGAGSFWNALPMAQQLQLQTLGMGASARPLQTGSSSTQSTSGLGTWLPQVLGAGVSGLSSYLGSRQSLGDYQSGVGSVFGAPYSSFGGQSALNAMGGGAMNWGGFGPMSGVTTPLNAFTPLSPLSGTTTPFMSNPSLLGTPSF